MCTRKLIQAVNEESRLMLPTTTSSCKYHLIGPSYICCYAKKGDLCVLKGLEGLGDRLGVSVYVCVCECGGGSHGEEESHMNKAQTSP